MLEQSASRGCEWRADVSLKHMFDMRPHLCDVSLVTDDDQHIMAHRVVLAANVHYFQAMFIGGQYVESGLYEIRIKGVSGHALNQIVR